jgi:dipeptidyl aminopeptidase/acylaminoacyl peptidase
MRILRRFAFPVLCVFYLVACNTAQTIPVEALGDTPTGVTTRFVFPTSGSNAEAYLTRPAGPGPFPLMILLHGHTLWPIGAESVVSEAEAFASDLCYAGLAISLPGYGATEVPASIDPNITLNVVLDALSLVKKLPWIDSKRLYLYGFSRGAFFAALLASRLDGVEGVILHSGAYDLNRFYQDTSWWFHSMLNPSGEQNPKLISILPEVSMWHAPTLILHGEEDLLVSVQQANLLSESLEAAKKPYRFVLYPHSGHRLPAEDVRSKATAFLAETSGSACRAAAF